MLKLFGKEITRAALMRRFGDPSQVFGVRLATLSDGLERGVRVLEFNTGSGFRFEVLIDRCMDIGSMHMGAASIGWHSPTGFRSPWLHEVDSESGLGWLRSFSGFMNTCGLDHIGRTTEENAAHYNLPSSYKIRHGLHGRVSYVPARLLGYGTAWDGDRCLLWAEGEVRQASVFAENLHLIRRIEAEVGSSTVTIRDRVVNRGFHATPHMLLYHVNIGWPVLTEGAELRGPIARTVWTSHVPSETSIGYRIQAGPQSNFREQVYEHALTPEKSGKVPVALINREYEWGGGSKGLAFMMEYDHAALPVLLQWQNLQEGHYVVGIEPCTAHVGTREEQKQRGDVRWLKHDESCSYELRFSALAGVEAIDELDRRIDAICVQSADVSQVGA